MAAVVTYRADTRNRRSEIAAVALVVLAIISIAFLLRGGSQSGYPVTISAGIAPASTADQVVDVAFAYLDAQSAQIADPDLHVEPRVNATLATTAADAPRTEPAIPASAVEQQPGRVVWIVTVDGDFLNVQDQPWSSSGPPSTTGTIVVDDATRSILGVFPHEPPTPTPSQ